MKDLENAVDWLSDDEYEEPEMKPKYMFTLTEVDICEPSMASQAFKGPSAPNSLFSSDIEAQVPTLFDLGTPKSLIKLLQVYTEHVCFHEVITIGKNLEVTIVGIGHVGELKDVLQPKSTSTPALLSFTNYLDSWPNSIALINSGRAIIYETSMDKCYRSTAELTVDIPNLPIVAEYI
jgi:hypothetical protein